MHSTEYIKVRGGVEYLQVHEKQNVASGLRYLTVTSNLLPVQKISNPDMHVLVATETVDAISFNCLHNLNSPVLCG